MPCRYDLLVIDLDGTLLSRDGSISTRNRMAIDRAKAAGIEIIIATGRALSESRAALSSLEYDGLVVAAGGSLLCDAVSGRTIDRRVMGYDVVHEVTRELVDHGHKALILKDAHATGYDYLTVGDGDFDPASIWWFSRLGIEVRHVDKLDDDEHPADSVRAGAVACESKLAPLAGRLREKMRDRCCLQHWSAVTESHAIGATTHLLEVFTPNVNKWTMIASYYGRKGLNASRIAAMGDGLNDIEMVQNAGLGVAMANASPQVKSVAARITTDHDADGVAMAIDNILCGAW